MGITMRIILYILAISLLASCSGTKKTSRSKTMAKPKKKKTSSRTAQKARGAMDTISWTEIDKSKDYYETIQDLDLEKRSSYKIKVFFPFSLKDTDLGQSTDNDTNLGRMTQFYSGMLMAIEQLESEGMSLNIQVMDAESGNFDSKLQSCRDADVIIGPMDFDQLAVTANFGKNNDIPVISPWRTHSKLSKDNPYLVQLIPGQVDHYDKIITEVKSKFQDKEICLLGRNKSLDKKYFAYMQRVAASINNDNNKRPLNEFVIDEDSLLTGETAFDSIFVENETFVGILPHWSFENDSEFVYNAVRKLSAERGFNKVILYGMPILLDSDRITFEHYFNLNMRICRSAYVDKTLPAVQEFRKKYYNNYKNLPTDSAYEGHDVMMLVGRHLFNYGKKFQFFMEDYDANLLQTRYDIQKVFKKNDDDQFKDIQYFQNKHLYILTFENNQFVAK